MTATETIRNHGWMYAPKMDRNGGATGPGWYGGPESVDWANAADVAASTGLTVEQVGYEERRLEVKAENSYGAGLATLPVR